MSEPRVHLDALLADGLLIDLPEGPFRHLVQVLRMGVGDAIRVFDGRGREFDARIESVAKRAASIRIGAARRVLAESPLDLTLAQAVSKGERMDYTLQKAVELGVRRIQPLITARSVVRLDAERSEKKMEHWRGVIASACEQCGRATLPELLPLLDLDHWLATSDAQSLRLTLDPEAISGIGGLARQERITLLVGPEGGLAPEELARARSAGFVGVRLGPRVLRTETTGVAALAALQTLWGDLA